MAEQQHVQLRSYLTVAVVLGAVGVLAAMAQQASSKSVMQIKVDHASVCGPELEPMRQGLAAVGLATDYGGSHAKVTHMALLGFEDGSYLELIAPQKPGVVEGSAWAKMMAENAGPCAWAVGTADIKGDVTRLSARGIKTEGPDPGSRKRPDGQMIEWETASVGPGGHGAMLPFMIQDHTPRSLRVQPSASVKASGLTGIDVVVLGVKDLEAASALFQRAYGWKAPSVEEHADFGAKLAYFPGTPVMVASPLGANSWLAKRLDQLGDSPVAYLLGTRDYSAASKRFDLSGRVQWFGSNVAWFDSGKLHGMRIGVIGR